MWNLADLWPWFLAALNLLLASVATVHAVLWKRDSRAAIAWVGLVWLAPLIGSTAYFSFAGRPHSLAATSGNSGQ